MTGKQTAVMWLGFLLIIVRLFTTNQWSELWGTIKARPASGVGSNQGASSASGGVPPASQGVLGPTGSRPL